MSPSQLLVFAMTLALSSGFARGGDEVLDSVMYRDPVIVVAKTESVFDPGLLKLWLAALERPEVEMRTSAALAIASAHRNGMTGLSAAITPLQRAMDQADQHPNVRLAVATALIALDAKLAADSLLKHVEVNVELRTVIDPALARWDHTPARVVWLEQLDKPPPYSRSLVFAVRSLAVVRETKAVPKLRELLFASDVTPPLRLEIARALAQITLAGLEADARRCTTDPLAAVSMVRHHSGDEAVRMLQGFASHKEDSVAAVALERLLEIDPKLALPSLDSVLANSDSETRRLGVELMARLPSDDHAGKLAGLLTDPHPIVRNHARRTLVKYADSPALRIVVQEYLVKVLNASDWRGQEQAALLAGQLKHKPVAERLVALLTAKRAEAFIAAAWALRELAVPETLPAIHDHLTKRYQQLLSSGPTAGLADVTASEVDRQLSQLAQFTGQVKYQPADATLRALVPRFAGGGAAPAYNPRGGGAPNFTPVGGETRAAAIWALGHLHSDQPDTKLTETLLGRLTGDPGLGPDDERVRRMVPVALARMKAIATTKTLRDYSEGDKPTLDVVSHACRWAVAELEKRPLPAPAVVQIPSKDWFLVPHK